LKNGAGQECLPLFYIQKGNTAMFDEGFLPQERLTQASVKRIKRIIEVFKKEFPDQCNWEELPQPADQSDNECDKALISTFGFFVKHLIKDDAMLQQAKKNPELESLALFAEQFKSNM
jgi:hypothetical protein